MWYLMQIGVKIMQTLGVLDPILLCNIYHSASAIYSRTDMHRKFYQSPPDSNATRNWSPLVPTELHTGTAT